MRKYALFSVITLRLEKFVTLGGTAWYAASANTFLFNASALDQTLKVNQLHLQALATLVAI
jgi:hypothetical protein